MSAKKEYVFRSPAGGGSKLHVPVEGGVVTFVADEPRSAPAKLVEQLREQGYMIEDTDGDEPDETDEEEPEPA